MSPKSEIIKANTIVTELEKDAIRCIAMFENWKRCNGNKSDIKTRFSYTYEAHSLGIIQDSLHIALIVALMRMLDRNSDSASIPTLIACLEQPGVIAALKGQSNAQASYVDQSMASIVRRYKRLENDETVKALRRLRNHALAHVSIKKSTRHKAKYGYEERVLRRILAIVRLFLLIVRSEGWDEKTYRKIWRQYANAFWQTASKSDLFYGQISVD